MLSTSLRSPSARTPRRGPCRRGPASRLPCATRRRGPSPLRRSGPLFLLRTASTGAADTRFRIMSCSGVRASGSVLRTHAVSPFSAAPRTRFRTTSCTRVRTTAGATAIASVSVLDTTAFTTSRTLRHSVAVAAPVRRVPRHPSPFACTPGFFVPDRIRGLWFSHPTQRAAGVRLAHLWPTPFCATDAFRRLVLVGSSVCRTDTRHPSCPWPCTAALVLHRYTDGTRSSLRKTRTDTRPTCAPHGHLDARGSVCPRPMHARNAGGFAEIPALGFPDQAWD